MGEGKKKIVSAFDAYEDVIERMEASGFRLESGHLLSDAVKIVFRGGEVNFALFKELLSKLDKLDVEVRVFSAASRWSAETRVSLTLPLPEAEKNEQ